MIWWSGFGSWIIGAVAQLGEHLLCKQGVVGSIPSGSTNLPVFIMVCEKKFCEMLLAFCLFD